MSSEIITTPIWYDIAKKEIGIKEFKGSKHNPRILQYHDETSLDASTDEVSWCSSFINWCMKRSGFPGTDSAVARSWLNWGISISTPALGCVIILKMGREAWQGHVGFFAGFEGDRVLILGGNQGNQVSISSYPRSKIIGYRWI